MMQRKSIFRFWAMSFIVCFICAVLSAYCLAGLLIAPNQQPVSREGINLEMTDISFMSASGNLIKGWYVPGAQGSSAVILIHGNTGNRKSMAGRAEFLNRNGYAVLLFDLSAHGESTGKYKTMGYFESLDTQAAVEYLKNTQKIKKVGVLGVSLGGASVLLGDKSLPVDAVVLESVYATVDQAISNRLKIKLGAWGPVLTKFITLQIKPRLGISLNQLRPVDKICDFKMPVFIIAGSEDKRTRMDESVQLYEKANQPKQFWEVPGAAHENFHDFDQVEYENRILGFFNEYL